MQIIGNGVVGQPNAADAQGIGSAFNGIASAFMDTGAQAARQQAMQLAARQAAMQGQLGNIFASGAYDPATGGAAISNGATAQQLGEVYRLAHSMSGGVNDPIAQRAWAGLGQYTASPLGVADAAHNASALSAQGATQAERLSAQQAGQASALSAQGASQAAAAANAVPTNFLMADGSIKLAPLGAPPQGAVKMLSTDEVKATVAAKGFGVLPGSAPAAAPLPTQVAAPSGPAGYPALNGGGLGTPPVAVPAPEASNFTPDQQAFLGITEAKARAAAEKNHVLAPGAQLFDGGGKLLASNSGQNLTPEGTAMLAQRLYQGDPNALQAAFRLSTADLEGVYNKLAEIGGPDAVKAAQTVIANKQDFAQGISAAHRTGALTAGLDIFGAEAAGIANLAVEASNNVPRSGFVPFAQAQLLGKRLFSDPAMYDFANKTQGLINAFTKFISPTGAPLESDKKRYVENLNNAASPEAYEAAARAMVQEINNARAAPRKAREAEKAGNFAGFPLPGNPIQGVPNGDGTMGGPPGSAGPAPKTGGTPPQGAIDMLKGSPTPQMQILFDQKYGQGAALKALTGH